MEKKAIDQKNLKNLLREGYQVMYEISKRITNDFEGLDRDSLKYVD